MLILSSFQTSINLLMLLQEYKCRDGMWSQAYETRHPTPEHPSSTLKSINPLQQCRQALAFCRAHHACFDYIHRTADCRRDKPSQHTRAEVRGEIIGHRCTREQETFETVIARQLACCHENGAHAVGPHAPEQCLPPLLPCHFYQAIDGAGVVSASGGRESSVVLHTDIEHVGRVTGYTTEKTRGRGDREQGRQRGCSEGRGCGGFFKFFVDAEAGGAVS